ncbi:uncharacterized protein VTP21DRAFT_2164 [Calcarisporiella thermophila]|uniref:uncharacterized protein n=1 Tax=Calcarisporiella thermophila TaxID=911321 RepID=UPI003742D1C6
MKSAVLLRQLQTPSIPTTPPTSTSVISPSTATNSSPMSTSRDDSPVSQTESLICHWSGCGQDFDDAELMYVHLCEDHIGRKILGNLCLECKWKGCNVKTTKRDHITSHVRVHVPLKPFTCEICKKSFKRPQDVRKHRRTHTEQQSHPDQADHKKLDHYDPLTPPHTSLSDVSPTIVSGESPQGLLLSPTSSTTETASPRSVLEDLFGSLTNGEEKGVKRGYNSIDSDSQAEHPLDNEFTIDDLLNEVVHNKKIKPDYDQDMMDRLDSLASNFVLEDDRLAEVVKNDQELDELNRWLTALTENINCMENPPVKVDGVISEKDAQEFNAACDAFFTQHLAEESIEANLSNITNTLDAKGADQMIQEFIDFAPGTEGGAAATERVETTLKDMQFDVSEMPRPDSEVEVKWEEFISKETLNGEEDAEEKEEEEDDNIIHLLSQLKANSKQREEETKQASIIFGQFGGPRPFARGAAYMGVKLQTSMNTGGRKMHTYARPVNNSTISDVPKSNVRDTKAQVMDKQKGDEVEGLVCSMARIHLNSEYDSQRHRLLVERVQKVLNAAYRKKNEYRVNKGDD